MTLSCPKQVIKSIESAGITNNDFEQVLLVTSNSQGKFINYHTLGVGDINSVGFNFRDLLKKIVMDDANGFFLIHNHPSNSTKPSNANLVSTKQIDIASSLASYTLLDHIIIGNNYFDDNSKYFSFRENGLIDNMDINTFMDRFIFNDYKIGGNNMLSNIQYEDLRINAISERILDDINERIDILNNEYGKDIVEVALSLYKSDEIENVFWDDFSQEFFDRIRNVVELDIAEEEIKSVDDTLVNSRLIIQDYEEVIEMEIREELDLISISNIGLNIDVDELEITDLIYFKNYQHEVVDGIKNEVMQNDYLSDYNETNNNFRNHNVYGYSLEEHLMDVLINDYIPTSVSITFNENQFYEFVQEVKPNQNMDLFNLTDNKKEELKKLVGENINTNLSNIESIKSEINKYSGNDLFEEKARLYTLGALSFNTSLRNDYIDNAKAIAILDNGQTLNSLYENLQYIKEELKMQVLLNCQLESGSELEFHHLEGIKYLIANDNARDSTIGNNEKCLAEYSDCVLNNTLDYTIYKKVYDQIENDYASFYDLTVSDDKDISPEYNVITNEDLLTMYEEIYKDNNACICSDLEQLETLYSNFYKKKYDEFSHVNINVNNQTVEVTVNFSINDKLVGVCMFSQLDDWKTKDIIQIESNDIYESLPELKNINSIENNNELEI